MLGRLYRKWTRTLVAYVEKEKMGRLLESRLIISEKKLEGHYVAKRIDEPFMLQQKRKCVSKMGRLISCHGHGHGHPLYKKLVKTQINTKLAQIEA